jgi:hypothetical protein
MSRFWSHILRFQPRFHGTEKQVRANLESHAWHNFRFSDIYPEASEDLPVIVTCRTCKVMADSNAASWACGEAPPDMSYHDYLKRKKLTG